MLKDMKAHITILLSALCFNLAFSEENAPEPANWNTLARSWDGAAEISHYNLKQSRYGKIREGEAVMIFTREPFLKDRQVKDESGAGNYRVLKLNILRSFNTGVYPYRTMRSVFQPLEKNSAGKALKVTTSIQEWCGHVFVQTNRRNGKLRTDMKSYFENEEGQTFEAKSSTLLEDEIWTALRVDPTGLPVGPCSIIPGSLHCRFSHQKPTAASANTRWLAGSKGQTLIYEISYPQTGRTLAIEISKNLPYEIEGWTESSRFQGLLSEGTLVKRVNNIDYWNYNDEAEGKKLRKTLKLRP